MKIKSTNNCTAHRSINCLVAHILAYKFKAGLVYTQKQWQYRMIIRKVKQKWITGTNISLLSSVSYLSHGSRSISLYLSMANWQSCWHFSNQYQSSDKLMWIKHLPCKRCQKWTQDNTNNLSEFFAF